MNVYILLSNMPLDASPVLLLNQKEIDINFSLGFVMNVLSTIF